MWICVDVAQRYTSGLVCTILSGRVKLNWIGSTDDDDFDDGLHRNSNPNGNGVMFVANKSFSCQRSGDWKPLKRRVDGTAAE